LFYATVCTYMYIYIDESPFVTLKLLNFLLIIHSIGTRPGQVSGWGARGHIYAVSFVAIDKSADERDERYKSILLLRRSASNRALHCFT